MAQSSSSDGVRGVEPMEVAEPQGIALQHMSPQQSANTRLTSDYGLCHRWGVVLSAPRGILGICFAVFMGECA